MDQEIGISKFKNINGVTCYMNSILSILQQIPIFSDYLVSGDFIRYMKEEKQDETIIYQLHKLLRFSMSMNNANLTPSSLRRVCSAKDYIWGEQKQQDSAEFLQFLISKMEEELGQNVLFIPGAEIRKQESLEDSLEVVQAISSYQSFVRKEFSPIKKFFTGLEQTSTRCMICGNKKNNFQPFTIWQLPIPVNKDTLHKEFELTDCIDKWMEEETLDDNNRLHCDFCCLKSNITKTYSLFTPPKILVIQLKRFLRDMYGNVSRKINNKVNFPIEDFDISKYLSKSSCHKDKVKYNLIGVNIHHELGSYANLNLGHYVSILKNRYDNSWYLFNDENNPIKVTNRDNIVNEKSYLLFYYRSD
jgi:ubiquitin C-terminal hydrolase